MPYINGQFEEPTNEDRARWAEVALDAYRAEVRGDMETAFRDLVGDLGHLWDQFKHELGDNYRPWEDEVASGVRSYEEEKEEES